MLVDRAEIAYEKGCGNIRRRYRRIFLSRGAGACVVFRSKEMRELSMGETAAVGGGIAPVVVVAIGILLATGPGCATTGGLRKGEKPSGEVVDPE